jgi:3',5'-cyclic AMP phosphodiesterase CpdA
MAEKPDIYNLVWQAFSFVLRPEPSKDPLRMAPAHLNTVDTRPNIPAVILFPSLLTPSLHVRGENGGKIQILVAAPSSPALEPEDVNRHLKLTPGLDAKKRVSDDDLFEDATDKIKVKLVKPDPLGQLKTTNGIFRGILHTSVSKWLPKELDAFYAIQIDESCLDADEQPDSDGDAASDDSSAAATPPQTEDSGGLEYQDFLIANVLQSFNGPALRGTGGFGKHEFRYDAETGVDYAHVDLDQPIVAYHPLYVYPEGSLQALKIGHVGDMHLNGRQKLLAKNPVKVIDGKSVASMMNIFEVSFLRVLDALDAKGIDVLFVAGDLIEHVDNAFPYHDGLTAEKLSSPNAATIWALVDPDNNYDRNYQAYVDYIAFFSAIRQFCARTRKPVFVVSGNHDAYKAKKIYGIVPTILWRKANEGIPADHNLTFYEARLIFGESWGILRPGTLFDKEHFQWFYAVLTPFADFRLELPRLRLVCLGWHDGEEVLTLWRAGEQGMAHLGRASQAGTPGQLALLKADPKGKKAVVMSHFTFVSHGGPLPAADRPAGGHVDVGQIYGSSDNGTFQELRRDMYGAVADPSAVACVLSGHSHRKGVYLLGTVDATGYPTEGYGLRRPHGTASPVSQLRGRPPIIVTDSCGPLPRLNLDGEFGGRGSDRPSGTLLTVSETGQVTHIEPVYSERQAKPRLAVAVDYMQILSGFVFKEIKVEPFKRADPKRGRLCITVTFHEFFPAPIAEGMTITLYSNASASKKDRWIEIPLVPDEFKPKTKSRGFVVQPESRGSFMSWLQLGSKASRFMSFHFGSAGGLEDIYDISTTWDIEVEANPSWWNAFRSGAQEYELVPPRETGAGDWMKRTHDAVPDFNWRRGLPPTSTIANPWNTPF